MVISRLKTQRRGTLLFKAIIVVLLAAVFVSGLSIHVPQHAAQASEISYLPGPTSLLNTTAAFNLPRLQGIRFFNNNPFEFEFLIDEGDSRLSKEELKEQSSRLISYFLASLTIPEEDLWVNLSPYEKQTIIPKELGLTEMGRDMLGEDYILKQLVASLTYPESPLGKQFWEKVYKKAYQLYGTIEIPLNTFNKVWIIPEKATIYERLDKAVIADTKLKVMLEEDYLALQKNKQSLTQTKNLNENQVHEISNFSSSIMKEVILPIIEEEVNQGKNFAYLRQIYNSLVLATWFKQKLKQSILTKIYADQKKIQGINTDDPKIKEKIYNKYVEAFQKGVYNYIKRDYDAQTSKYINRRYFSGGLAWDTVSSAMEVIPADTLPQIKGISVRGNVEPLRAIQESPDLAPKSERHIKRDKPLKNLIEIDKVRRVTEKGEVKPEYYGDNIFRRLAARFKYYLKLLWHKIVRNGMFESTEHTVVEKLTRIREQLLRPTAFSTRITITDAYLEEVNKERLKRRKKPFQTEEEVREELYKIAKKIDLLVVKNKFTLHFNGPYSHVRRGVSGKKSAIWIGEKIFVRDAIQVDNTTKFFTDEVIAWMLLEDAKHILAPQADHSVIAHSSVLQKILDKLAESMGELPTDNPSEEDLATEDESASSALDVFKWLSQEWRGFKSVEQAMEQIKRKVEKSRETHPERPILILVDGIPNSGKTELASAINPVREESIRYGGTFKNLGIEGLAHDVVVIYGDALASSFQQIKEDARLEAVRKDFPELYKIRTETEVKKESKYLLSIDEQLLLDDVEGIHSQHIFSVYLGRFFNRLFEHLAQSQGKKDRIVFMESAALLKYFKDALSHPMQEDILVIGVEMRHSPRNLDKREMAVKSFVWKKNTGNEEVASSPMLEWEEVRKDLISFLQDIGVDSKMWKQFRSGDTVAIRVDDPIGGAIKEIMERINQGSYGERIKELFGAGEFKEVLRAVDREFVQGRVGVREAVLNFGEPVYLGGNRMGGEGITLFIEDNFEVWIEVAPHIDGALVPFRLSVQNDQVKLQQYDQKFGSPVADAKTVEVGREVNFGRISVVDYSGEILVNLISREHFSVLVIKNDPDQWKVIVKDLESKHGTRAELSAIVDSDFSSSASSSVEGADEKMSGSEQTEKTISQIQPLQKPKEIVRETEPLTLFEGREKLWVQGDINDVRLGNYYVFPSEFNFSDETAKRTTAIGSIGLEKSVEIQIGDTHVLVTDNHYFVTPYIFEMFKRGILSGNSSMAHIDDHKDLLEGDNFNFREYARLKSDRERLRYVISNLSVAGWQRIIFKGGIVSEKDWLWLDLGDSIEINGDHSENLGKWRWHFSNRGEYRLGIPQAAVNEGVDIVDVDMDFLGPLELLISEQEKAGVLQGRISEIIVDRLDAVAHMASKAKVVTIATSPHYIDQKRAIIYAKAILNRIKELKSAQGVSSGSSKSSPLPKTNESSDQALLAFNKPVYLGGKRRGGECVSPFTDKDIEVWVELSPDIEDAQVPFRIWRQDGQMNVERYVSKLGEPIEKDREVLEPGLDFVIGREYLESKDKAGNIKVSSISRWHCAMRMEENDAGQYRIVVSDLNSTHGLRVEMRTSSSPAEGKDDLSEPGHGPGAGPIIEGPNNLVREARALIGQGKDGEAKALLREAISQYQEIYEAGKDDEADTLSYEMSQAAQKNISIAQELLQPIESKEINAALTRIEVLQRSTRELENQIPALSDANDRKALHANYLQRLKNYEELYVQKLSLLNAMGILTKDATVFNLLSGIDLFPGMFGSKMRAFDKQLTKEDALGVFNNYFEELRDNLPQLNGLGQLHFDDSDILFSPRRFYELLGSDLKADDVIFLKFAYTYFTRFSQGISRRALRRWYDGFMEAVPEGVYVVVIESRSDEDDGLRPGTVKHFLSKGFKDCTQELLGPEQHKRLNAINSEVKNLSKINRSFPLRLSTGEETEITIELFGRMHILRKEITTEEKPDSGEEAKVATATVKNPKSDLSKVRRTSSAGAVNKGGIDLNVNEIEVKGAGLYLPDFNIPFNIENFGGFTFHITSIERVQDWASAEVVVEGPQT